jgi:myo-inositol-1(or 4)-monophosphatase
VTAPDPIFLATATEIVLRAGDIQLAGRASGFRVDKKGVRDLVTEVDLACERMCREIIGERFPDHDILAEELGGGPGEARTARHRWVFDPVDGTTNYAHGLPIYCASLGLEIDGELAVGAIYDPTRRELFTAERGAGAYLNGTPLHVSEAASVLDALAVTGFAYDLHRNASELVGLFESFLRRTRAVRRLGSAALDLCYVAAGRFDGFWEERLKPWDVAAGILIVTEAGGRVTGMDGGPFDMAAGHLLATNGVIHREMLEIIADFRNGKMASGLHSPPTSSNA